MAILKHLTNKSSNYVKALEYLIYQHNEFTQKPILDENGNLQLREELFLAGLNCQPLTFAKECEQLNAQYHKNQNINEIKSHHYIISFDPRDAKAGLTGEKAQKIGLEFARKYFDGHQALVCTHTDGHNRSGNIHVHIVINSLRKIDVDHQDFMERDYDHRAGYKHHQTRQYLTAMQEGLMKICEREHLHQVDLLSPASEHVTDREYRLKQRQNQKQDVPDASSQSNSSVNSKFQTQKQYLQDAIREVSSYAHDSEEFGKELLELYGIRFKISRGRFSYLHPDRQKYMTGRTLGNDYTEKYLMPLFEGNKAAGRTREHALQDRSQISPASQNVSRHSPHTKDHHPPYDPSYDYHSNPVAALYFRTKLRLVVDLQDCAKAQASRAYARKVKLTNLQQMAQTICYVQEHGFNSQSELEKRYAEQEMRMKGMDSNDPSYQQVKRTVHELKIVSSNVKVILQMERSQEHDRSHEKTQDLS